MNNFNSSHHLVDRNISTLGLELGNHTIENTGDILVNLRINRFDYPLNISPKEIKEIIVTKSAVWIVKF